MKLCHAHLLHKMHFVLFCFFWTSNTNLHFVLVCNFPQSVSDKTPVPTVQSTTKMHSTGQLGIIGQKRDFP